MWFYKTEIGTFKIIRQSNGRYGLWMEDDLLGNHPSPQSAADDVFMCATGHWPWDQRLMVTEPTDLGQWQQVR